MPAEDDEVGVEDGADRRGAAPQPPACFGDRGDDAGVTLAGAADDLVHGGGEGGDAGAGG